jgi:LPXTG-motif cell wall-anchored protein
MSRSRAIVALLALVLALPSAAFAQGAGDEQYQDPFGGEQTQGQDDGLSQDPPGGGDGGEAAPPPADDGADDEQEAAPSEPRTLPNTGSDPRIIAWAGLVFLLAGIGLRMRSADPDAF